MEFRTAVAQGSYAFTPSKQQHLRVPAKRRMGYQQVEMERTKEFPVRLQATRDSAGNAFSRQLALLHGIMFAFSELSEGG